MDMHSFATCTSSVVLSVTRTTERSHVVVLRQIPDPEPVVEIQVLFSTRNKDTIPVFHPHELARFVSAGGGMRPGHSQRPSATQPEWGSGSCTSKPTVSYLC